MLFAHQTGPEDMRNLLAYKWSSPPLFKLTSRELLDSTDDIRRTLPWHFSQTSFIELECNVSYFVLHKWMYEVCGRSCGEVMAWNLKQNPCAAPSRITKNRKETSGKKKTPKPRAKKLVKDGGAVNSDHRMISKSNSTSSAYLTWNLAVFIQSLLLKKDGGSQKTERRSPIITNKLGADD